MRKTNISVRVKSTVSSLILTIFKRKLLGFLYKLDKMV